MKIERLLFYIILMIGNVVLAGTQKSSHTFLFCLKPEIKPLEIALNREKANVGINELDDYFQSYNVVRIEPWIENATEIDRDGEIYLNRIYRVYLDKSSDRSASQLISSIQEFPFVLYAEPEYIRKPYYAPNDPQYPNQCSLKAVRANEAWEYFIDNGDAPGDKNILLVSVDTGVDYTHPDLIENIWVNQEELLANTEVSALSEIIDLNADGNYSAFEIDQFMSYLNDDLNGDGKANIRDALYTLSPFADGLDNDGNGKIDDIIGWDVSGASGHADNDPFPKVGVHNSSDWAHGTHVAGILAATTDNGIGMASAIFNGKILSVKCARDESDESTINNGYAGITYAAQVGFSSNLRTIINCSWGGGGYNSSENSVINNAMNTYGAIIVAAAGNGDEDTHQEEYAAHYPASYANVVSVCALSCDGNWGGWATYHASVDLAAPGENISSTIIGGGYQSWDGSSMASPNAASVIGLVWSYYPEWTKEDVIEQISLSADSSIYHINSDYMDCNGNEGEYCLGAGMVDAHKAIAQGFSPNIQAGSYIFTETLGDGDGKINPGETGNLSISLKNSFGWANALSVEAVLSTEDPNIIIHKSNSIYGNIYSGDSLYNINDPFTVSFSSEIVLLEEIKFKINITATSSESEYHYNRTFEYMALEVSLNQIGFPISTDGVRASPLLIDLDADGNNEVIIGDKLGVIHIYNIDGVEVQDDLFPYNTGQSFQIGGEVNNNAQIWGSAAAADIDNDGHIEFVISSKSKYLYIFSQVGLEAYYDADQYLMGTPAIGNIDSDEELEVVFASYPSSNDGSAQLFVINPDGSDVDGFPLILGENVKFGVSLADFNGNGKDDIVLGTDSHYIHLIFDNGSEADGFPYQTGDKIWAAPSVADIDGEKIIFTGCNDNKLYAINSDGSLRFTVATGGKVQSSPSFLQHIGEIYIFFGSNDDKIYAIDKNGDALDGWPIDIGVPISKSIVFSDIDCDGEAEIIGVNIEKDVLAFNIDGTLHTGFPIKGTSAFTGSPAIFDLDNDGDLEILSGATNHFTGIDIKSVGSDTSYWNVYRGNLRRTGYTGTSPIGEYIADCPEQLSNITPHHISSYQLKPLYPNPFNPITTISYDIPRSGEILIEAYNIRGRLVDKIISTFQSAGYYSIEWDASSYPSGIYFISMKSDSFWDTRKVLLIK